MNHEEAYELLDAIMRAEPALRYADVETITQVSIVKDGVEYAFRSWDAWDEYLQEQGVTYVPPLLAERMR